MTGPSPLEFSQGLNRNAGLITLTTVVVLVFTNSWRIQWQKPKYMVVLMVYADAIAVFISWTATLTRDVMSTCSNLSLFFAADFVWSIKDALKYSYFVYRTVRVCLPEQRHPLRIVKATAVISAILYWILMSQVYDFSMCQSSVTSAAQGVVWSLPALYFFWCFVDVITGVFLVRKLLKHSSRLTTASSTSYDLNLFPALATREEFRLAISGGLMLLVTVLSLIKVFLKKKDMLTMNAVVFTLVQTIIVCSVISKTRATAELNLTRRQQPIAKLSRPERTHDLSHARRFSESKIGPEDLYYSRRTSADLFCESRRVSAPPCFPKRNSKIVPPPNSQ